MQSSNSPGSAEAIPGAADDVTSAARKPDSAKVAPAAATNRRRFIAGAGMGVLGAGVLGIAPEAFGRGTLSRGDAAIQRFLAAAEILETDLWQQYNELCGIQDHEVPGGSGNSAF